MAAKNSEDRRKAGEWVDAKVLGCVIAESVVIDTPEVIAAPKIGDTPAVKAVAAVTHIVYAFIAAIFVRTGGSGTNAKESGTNAFRKGVAEMLVCEPEKLPKAVGLTEAGQVIFDRGNGVKLIVAVANEGTCPTCGAKRGTKSVWCPTCANGGAAGAVEVDTAGLLG